jgi:hypothetical protein
MRLLRLRTLQQWRITERLSDSLEWGEPDPEDDYPDVTGPDWIIDNIAHFGG